MSRLNTFNMTTTKKYHFHSASNERHQGSGLRGGEGSIVILAGICMEAIIA